MKWLEIIELRSVKGQEKTALSQIHNIIENLRREDNTFKVYSRIIIDSDLSIHLFHDSDAIANSGSRLGLLLVSALREFGMTRHSIWVEIQP